MFTEQFLSTLADAVAARVVAQMATPKTAAPRLMDTDQAAAYLGLPSASALRQRKACGQIPDSCFVKMGGSVLYDRLALDAWINSLREVN